MNVNARNLTLDIYDYSKHKICNLYDNKSNASGQATDVCVTTERNGWKELSFTIPSTCTDIDKSSDSSNYRTQFLKADYLIRLVDDYETDWFIISEPRITHNAYAKNISVTAGHVSQLLKSKNLGLEFSDDEGNNTGTANELLTTILDGTGWAVGYVYPFAEKDGSTKYRSLKSSSKTGAFKLISTMCDLFDAKPIYHGDNRTVDIVPINPFSETPNGHTPDVSKADGVVELHYGKNVSNVQRSLNTENLITRLYAYGAYGDKTYGYCGIDIAEHAEYIFTVNLPIEKNHTYWFSTEDEAKENTIYHFSPTESVSIGTRLIFSTLDFASKLYIWNESTQRAYWVSEGTSGSELPANVNVEQKKNWFSFLMNFDYYKTIGLLDDDMMQKIAAYQRNAPDLFVEISKASEDLSNARTKLSEIIGSIDFCRLSVERAEQLSDDGEFALILDKSEFNDGVIYRTDYSEKSSNYFKWRTNDSFDSKGDPKNPAASMIFIVHDTVPISWDKAYLKALDDDNNPSVLRFWNKNGKIELNDETDQYFLFSYNGINGYLGSLEAQDEAALTSLSAATKVVTVEHPCYFTDQSESAISTDGLNGYGWLWKYKRNGSDSEFYFCYKDESDSSWRRTYFTEKEVAGEENSYWFDWRNSKLYRRTGSKWALLDTTAEKKIADVFATVYMYGKTRDKYYQGIFEKYVFNVPDGNNVSTGNYFIDNGYGGYWTFTTTSALNAGDSIVYDRNNAWVIQTANDTAVTLDVKNYRFDNVQYHPSNILDGRTFESGSIDSGNGDEKESDSSFRSEGCIAVVPNTSYNIRGFGNEISVHFYDGKKRWMSCLQHVNNSFSTPGECEYIRFCKSETIQSFNEKYVDAVVSADNLENLIVISGLNYVRLSPIAKQGENVGIVECIKKLSVQADETYIDYYGKLKEAQNRLTSLEKSMTASIGDLYREGYWQDDSYVAGDEKKLYDDAIDNLNEVGKPEANYSINFLDLFDANVDDAYLGLTDDTSNTRWPDITTSMAVHLIDPDIGVNTWAYLDKIQKYYDKSWLTKITINTKLSTIAQHSFSDVMTNIADVASEMKGKRSYYDKTTGTAATTNQVVQIAANITANEKKLNSTYDTVVDLSDTVIHHSSRITQTDDLIETEVSRAINEEKKIRSQIKQTADSIELNVLDETNPESIASKLELTSNQVKTEILGDNNSLKSQILQNKDTIETRILGNGNDSLSSKISQTSGRIEAIVTGQENATTLKTSSVTIDGQGVSINTGGTFTVGSGNFDLDVNGKLSATDAYLSGTVISGGYPVMTSGYDIVVSTTEPKNNLHAGMIWIYPGVISSDSGSGGGTIPETQTTAHVEYTGNKSFGSRGYVGSSESASAYVMTLRCDSQAQTKPNNTSCSYILSVPIYIRKNSNYAINKHGATMRASLSNGSSTIYFYQVVIASSEGNYNISFTITGSSDWIGNADSLTMKVWAETYGSYYRGNMLYQSAPTIKLQCDAR